MPRQYAICKLTERFKKNGVLEDNKYIFLGEIPNMPGHCVVINDANGGLLAGIPLEYFEEVISDGL